VIVAGNYREQCDMWSLGVVIFVLLFGFPPFDAEDLNGSQIIQQLTDGFTPLIKPGRGPWFPSDIPCSEACRDLITKLLVLNPAERLTAAEVVEHPWTTGEKADEQPRIRKVFKNLAQFAANTRLREQLLKVMVSAMGRPDLEYWRRKFETMDVNKDGKITVSDLEVILDQELAEEGTKGGSAAAADDDDGDNAASAGGGGKQKNLTKADLKKIVKICGRDGAIGYRELIEMVMHRWVSRTEDRLWNEFCKLDVSRKGRIGVDELAKVFGESVTRE